MDLDLSFTSDVQTCLSVVVDPGKILEIFGDPSNASYEWRVIEHGKLVKYSDVGYSAVPLALRDGLCFYYGPPSPGLIENLDQLRCSLVTSCTVADGA